MEPSPESSLTHLTAAVFGVMVILALASLLPSIARRLNLPYTVLLALFGGSLGYLSSSLQPQDGMSAGLFADLILAYRGYDLSADGLLYLFLPPLLFAAGLYVDARRLMDDLWPVILLAVVAVLVCTVIVGVVLAAFTPYGIVACLLLGSIVATTDSAAIVAVFREIGAPRRLSIIVEGESLFNDAAAIALFTVLVTMLITEGGVQPMDGLLAFVKGLAGGIVFGYVFARLFCTVIVWLEDAALPEITLTIALAYLTFILGEAYLGVSGVIAVVTAAMVIGSEGRTRISPDNWDALRDTWRVLEFVATCFIFVMAAMMTPQVLAKISWTDVKAILLLFAATLAARGLVLYGLMPGLSRFKLAAPISGSYKAVLVWGGLRGAVTVALALSVSEQPAIPEEVRHFILFTATGYVLMTLFFLAPSLRPLMRTMGLDVLSEGEKRLRDRVRAMTRKTIGEQLHALAEETGLAEALHDPDKLAGAGGADAQGKDKPSRAAETDRANDLSDEDYLEAGLMTVASQEAELVLDYFKRGIVSRNIADLLRADAGRLIDGAKTGGIDGYLAAAFQSTGVTPRFWWALWVHRRLRYSRPLSWVLADRFEVLLIKEVAIRDIRRETIPTLADLVGSHGAERLDAMLGQRVQGIKGALESFELQYPEYARILRLRFLEQMALGLEKIEYRRNYDLSVVNSDIYEALETDRSQRRRRLDDRPKLDLGLRLTAMLERVPIFGALSESEIQAVAKMLVPELAMPGERLIRSGDPGERMYFIASGEVEVMLPSGTVCLGSGDFFGELALLTDAPRNADVVAAEYCNLLVLSRKSFKRLLRSHGEMRRKIETVAHERLNGRVA